MAGASISIEYEAGKALDFIRRLGEHIDDLSPLFGDIGEYLIESTQARFDVQQSPDGEPWLPLSPRYARRKPKNADRILVLDALMRDTLAYNAGPREMEFGTNRIYAATHQFGRGNIPARPFLGISDDDENEILKLLRDYVADEL